MYKSKIESVSLGTDFFYTNMLSFLLLIEYLKSQHSVNR